MDLETLQGLLADWYEVPASGLGLAEGALPDCPNLVLREFYSRLGALTRCTARFAHPDSHNLPLSCQEHVIPVEEVATREGFTEFCEENQAVFTVAASDVPDDTQTYARGDAIAEGFIELFTPVGVPLQECLVTCVLRETILSVGDRYRRITPDSLKAARQVAAAGETIESRFIWPDAPLTFHLSRDVWVMQWGRAQFAAHRGLWRQAPSTWQEQVFEGGGGWSIGPTKPTLAQRFERILTGLRR